MPLGLGLDELALRDVHVQPVRVLELVAEQSAPHLCPVEVRQDAVEGEGAVVGTARGIDPGLVHRGLGDGLGEGLLERLDGERLGNGNGHKGLHV